jgi:hypothetical protein
MLHRLPRFAIAATIVATLGAVSLPAAASAAIAVDFDPGTKTLRLTGDQVAGSPNDVITLDVSQSRYFVGAQDTGVPAAADVKIAIEGGAGVDQITFFLVPFSSLIVHGGGENDRIRTAFNAGLAHRYQLFGDDGDDFIATVTDASDVSGGRGDDLILELVNAPDQPLSGTVTGDEGSDSLEIDGNACGFDLTAAPAAAGHAHVRTTVPATADCNGGAPTDADVSGVEALTVQGTSERDTIVAASGLTSAFSAGMAAFGDAGNDAITGGDGADTLMGGEGDDTISGGGGHDEIHGDAGNDAIDARDGAADIVRGGVGEDSARVDDRDGVDGVEHVDVAPGASPPTTVPPTTVPPTAVPRALAAAITAARITLVRSHGRLLARVPLACPAAAVGRCATTITLQTAKAVTLGRVRVIVTLGRGQATLSSGQLGVATVAIPGSLGLLFAHQRLTARASLVSVDGNGNAATAARTLALAAPRPKARAHKRKR